jgi:hypothetical protein
MRRDALREKLDAAEKTLVQTLDDLRRERAESKAEGK